MFYTWARKLPKFQITFYQCCQVRWARDTGWGRQAQGFCLGYVPTSTLDYMYFLFFLIAICMWISAADLGALSHKPFYITHSLWNFFLLIFPVVFYFASFLTHLNIPPYIYLFLDLWLLWFEFIIHILSQHSLYITPLNACFPVHPCSPQIPRTPHKADLMSQGPLGGA